MLSSAAGIPADVINCTRGGIQRARLTCVTSCSTCWRLYGNVIGTLLVTTWHHVQASATQELWTKVVGYRQEMLNREWQRKYRLLLINFIIGQYFCCEMFAYSSCFC